MKVRSNPAQGPVQYPNMPGVHIGAALESKDGKIVASYSPDPVELLAEGETAAQFFAKHPHEFAYLVKKVQEGELFAADAEMAKAAGVEMPKAEAPLAKFAAAADAIEAAADRAFAKSAPPSAK